MKRSLSILSLVALSTFAFAQTTTPTTTAPSAPATGAAKPKPLSSADKSFVKNSTESIFFLNSMADQAKRLARDNNVSENVKTFTNKMASELGKVWGEVGAIASAAGETLPVAVKGSDKTKLAALGKLKEDKFEKEYAELSAKELKHLVAALDSGAKSVQNTELKAIAEKWGPTVKGISDDATTLSKTVGKK